MSLLLAVLIIAALIFVRKNNTIARILSIIAAIIYIISTPYVLIFSAMTVVHNYYTFFQCLVYTALLIASAVLIWKKKNRAAQWTLWIMLALLFLHDWNIWFDIILRFILRFKI